MATAGSIRTVLSGFGQEDQTKPMQTGNAKGLGMTYKWVELPTTERSTYTTRVTEPMEWCKERFGRLGVRWFEKQEKFYFKDERDASLFILKWS